MPGSIAANARTYGVPTVPVGFPVRVTVGPVLVMVRVVCSVAVRLSSLVARALDYGGAFAYVGTTLGYALFYSALLLALASAIFHRRDFL